jgi:hypothetical protein
MRVDAAWAQLHGAEFAFSVVWKGDERLSQSGNPLAGHSPPYGSNPLRRFLLPMRFALSLMRPRAGSGAHFPILSFGRNNSIWTEL